MTVTLIVGLIAAVLIIGVLVLYVRYVNRDRYRFQRRFKKDLAAAIQAEDAEHHAMERLAIAAEEAGDHKKARRLREDSMVRKRQFDPRAFARRNRQ